MLRTKAWYPRTLTFYLEHSLIRTCRTLIFVRVRLKSFPSVLVCNTLTEDEPNVLESRREKSNPNKVHGRDTASHHCEFGKILDDPSYCTVPWMSSWNDVIIISTFGDVQSPRVLLLSDRQRRCVVVSSVLYISHATVAARMTCRWWMF